MFDINQAGRSTNARAMLPTVLDAGSKRARQLFRYVVEILTVSRSEGTANQITWQAELLHFKPKIVPRS